MIFAFLTCAYLVQQKNTGLRLVQKTLKYQLKVSEVRANRYIKKFKSQKVCHALRDLVPFVQFKKPEEHPWGSATFSSMGVFHGF